MPSGDNHLYILSALSIISASSGDGVLHQWLPYLVVLETGGLSDLVAAAVLGLGAAELGLEAGAEGEKGETCSINSSLSKLALKEKKTEIFVNHYYIVYFVPILHHGVIPSCVTTHLQHTKADLTSNEENNQAYEMKVQGEQPESACRCRLEGK